MPGFISVGNTVDVTLLSEKRARIDVVVRRKLGGEVSETLATTIAEDVGCDTACATNVFVEVVPLLTHSGISPRE